MIDGAELWVVYEHSEVRLASSGPARDGIMRFGAVYDEADCDTVVRTELRSGAKRADIRITWSHQHVLRGAVLTVDIEATKALDALRRLA